MEQARNEEQKPCRICVDFYGTASTNFLCSKCSREQNLRSQEADAQKRQLEQKTAEFEATQLPTVPVATTSS